MTMKRKEEARNKTMTNTTRDEMKAVERWENEGGRLSDKSRERAVLAQRSFAEVYSEGMQNQLAMRWLTTTET